MPSDAILRTAERSHGGQAGLASHADRHGARQRPRLVRMIERIIQIDVRKVNSRLLLEYYASDGSRPT